MSTYKIKISKDERHSIYASVFLFIFGYALAIGICDPAMFARFGSLIVCIGVIFGVKGLPQQMDAVLPIYEKQIQKLRDFVESSCQEHEFEPHIRHAMAEKVEPEIVDLEQKMKRTMYSLKSRFLKIEGGVVIIGTLVWGFGDYLVPCLNQLCQK